MGAPRSQMTIMLLLLTQPSRITLFMPVSWLLPWPIALLLVPFLGFLALAYIWNGADDGAAFLVAAALIAATCYSAIIAFVVRLAIGNVRHEDRYPRDAGTC